MFSEGLFAPGDFRPGLFHRTVALVGTERPPAPGSDAAALLPPGPAGTARTPEGPAGTVRAL